MRIFWLLSCLTLFSCQQNEHTNDAAPVSEEARLKSAIKEHPDSLLLVETLIQLYRDSGRSDDAIRLTDSILTVDSLLANFWEIRAVLQYENSDTLNAIRDLEKAVALVPADSYLYSLALLYAQSGDNRSVVLADTLITRDKKHWEKESWLLKGYYHAAVKEYQKAINCFDKALALSFTYMEAYREKAIALMNMNRNEEALAVLDRAITLKNGFEEGHYYRGQVLEKLNRPEEALGAYESALMYDRDYQEARVALDRLTQALK